MRIVIETVKPEDQRYPTAGDWYYEDDGTLVIKVNEATNWRYPILVALHELVEVQLCRHHGITQHVVDEFDMGEGKDLDEPGEDARAPYFLEHKLATMVELWMAKELGVEWSSYDNWCGWSCIDHKDYPKAE